MMNLRYGHFQPWHFATDSRLARTVTSRARFRILRAAHQATRDQSIGRYAIDKEGHKYRYGV